MTFYLCDPYLIDYAGHSYNYLEIIRRELETRGVNTRLIGNEALVPELRKLGIDGFFSQSNMASIKFKLKNSLIRNLKFLSSNIETANSKLFEDNIEKLINIYNIGYSDAILINSLRPWQFFSLARWLSRQDLAICPKIFIVLHYTSSHINYSGYVFSKLYRKAFKLADLAIDCDRLIVLADTKPLINEFSSMSKNKVMLAPIPILKNDFFYGYKNFETKNLEFTLTSKTEAQPKTISYVGHPRKEKGFHLLPEILDGIKPLIGSKKIQFQVQTGDLNLLNQKEYKITNYLRNNGAKIIDQALSVQKYYELILESDIILLPYQGQTYKIQSSGIFAEAIFMGKIVITTERSWMGQQLNELGLVEHKKKPLINSITSEIVNNIYRIVLEYETEAKKFKIASTKWQDNQNISRFIDILIN